MILGNILMMTPPELLFPEERLDLRDKAAWTMANAPTIARQIGCEPTPEFEDCLKNFIENNVRTATVANFLDVIFSNILAHQPFKEAA